MRFFLTLLFTSCVHFVVAQCPSNIDFELGNLNNWQCSKGFTQSSVFQNIINLTPSAPTPNRHEIISAANAGTDAYGNFPTLCPYGGGYSIKLGNEYSGSQAEGVSYTFQIPANADTFSLIYYYAVVFEDPGHDPSEQPRFFVTAYDVATNQLIDCASYNYISSATIPGFHKSLRNRDVLYKDWTPSSIDFSGLAGRTVRLEFKTADCTLGAHFGYGYVDVGNGCGGVIAAASFCGNINSVILNAPYGFQSYTWYNSNYSAVVGTQQLVTLSPPPPPNTLFHVDMIPYPGFGCRDTADAKVLALPIPDTPIAVTYHDLCQNDYPPALTASTTNPNSLLLWYSTANGGNASNDAPIPTTNNLGTFHYYVTQKALLGCESSRKDMVVNVLPTPQTFFGVNNFRQCQDVNNFVFLNSTTNTTSTASYKWEFGDGDTSVLENPSHTYSTYGSFDVKLKALNPPVCSKEISIPVYVIAKPVADFTYPMTICEYQTPIAIRDNSWVPGGSGTVNQWQWTIGSTLSNAQYPPSFFSEGGQLPVSLSVSTYEGCNSDIKSVDLQIHYKPTVGLKNSNPCNNELIKFTDLSVLPSSTQDIVNKWNWQFDGQNSTLQNPVLNLNSGNSHIVLTAESNQGCINSLDTNIIVFEKPHIQIRITDSCVRHRVEFMATNTGVNAATTWVWNFLNSSNIGDAVITKTYSTEGYYPVTLVGKDAHGCLDTVFRPFTIFENHSFAGNDTIAALGQPVQLNAGGGNTVNYSWSPSNGLNDAHAENPVATLDRDQLYELKSMSIYGCESNSNIFIKRYKGPELYIPSAFTPNGDGLNDILRVIGAGISRFSSFSIYDRFGTRLFYTTNINKGWDGTYRGTKMQPGSFVYYIQATDYKGKMMSKKGSVMLFY